MRESTVAHARRQVIAPRFGAGDAILGVPSAPGTAASSSEHKLRVEFDPGFPQQRKELLLKTPLAVMLPLPGDVRNDGLPPRLAYAERAVTSLPGEAAGYFIQPTR